MTLMCDASIYDLIPVKKEVKATVSGIYITAVKGVRGSLEAPPKKKGFWARLRKKKKKRVNDSEPIESFTLFVLFS